MKAKLIKTEVNYILEDDKGVIIASTSLKKEGLALSLKNCEAIKNGYEFDEYQEGVFYASKFGHPSPEGFSEEQVGRLHGFIDGFQKALKLLGDKRFNEEEMKKSFEYGATATLMNSQGRYNLEKALEIMFEESLQQNKWDVEIEMETCSMNPYDLDCNEIVERPKIDTDGCLILRRI